KACVAALADLVPAPLTRRTLLAWSARVAAAVAWSAPLATLARAAASPSPRSVASPAGGAAAAADPVAAARADLRRLVVERALATDDPWVLMHALLPLGPDARHGGELAV